MQDQSLNKNINGLEIEVSHLVDAVVEAVVMASQTQEIENAVVIRDEIRRLPSYLVTEVLTCVILKLVKINPILCRWFILDIFLRDADSQGKADVAERINILIADLQSL